MLCTEIDSDIQNPCSAKRRASDKDLPVFETEGANCYGGKNSEKLN